MVSSTDIIIFVTIINLDFSVPKDVDCQQAVGQCSRHVEHLSSGGSDYKMAVVDHLPLPVVSLDHSKVTLKSVMSHSLLLQHKCNKKFFLYANQQLYLSHDGFSSTSPPLAVNIQNLEDSQPVVSSVAFVNENLVLVMDNEVFTYNLASGFLRKSSGIESNVTEVTTFACCHSLPYWCADLNSMVVAFEKDAMTTRFHLSRDMGVTFELMAIPGVVQGHIRSVVILNSFMVVVALVSTNSSEAKFIAAPYRDIVSPTMFLSFHVTGGEFLATQQFYSGFGSILVWDAQTIYYSPSSGQTVLPVYHHPTEDSHASTFLTGEERFRQVTTSENGEFALLTSLNELYFGREGFRAEAVHVDLGGVKIKNESVMLFTEDGNIQFFTPVFGASDNSSIAMSKETIDIQYILRHSKPPLPQCQIQTLATDYHGRYFFLDQHDVLELITTLVPRPWHDNRLIVDLSNPQLLDARSSYIHQEEEITGVFVKVLKTVLRPNADAHRMKISGVPSVRVSATRQSLSCRKNPQAVAHVSVGCPPTKHIEIRNLTWSCDQYREYNFTVASADYDPSFYQGRFGGSANADKVVFYNHAKIGCPINAYYMDSFKPRIYLYEQNKFVEEVTKDYAIYEINGIAKYSFTKKVNEIDCLHPPQTWISQLKAQAIPNPSTAWNRENYRSCQHKPINATYIPQPEDAYDVLNSQSANSIEWASYDGLLIFEVIVLDPTYSLCDLRTQFAVKVYGSPPVSKITGLLVAGCTTIGGLFALYVSFVTLLKARRIKKEKAHQQDILDKLDLTNVAAQLEGTNKMAVPTSLIMRPVPSTS